MSQRQTCLEGSLKSRTDAESQLFGEERTSNFRRMSLLLPQNQHPHRRRTKDTGFAIGGIYDDVEPPQ